MSDKKICTNNFRSNVVDDCEILQAYTAMIIDMFQPYYIELDKCNQSFR